MPRFESHSSSERCDTTTVEVKEAAAKRKLNVHPYSKSETYDEQKRHTAPSQGGKDEATRDELSRRVKLRELCVATRQLASLLRGGMPLVPALAVLIEQQEKRPLAQILQIVREQVNTGSGFAEALQQFNGVFSAEYVSLVRAGEISGTLEEVLARLGQMLEKQLRFRNKLKTAFAYPALMAVAAVGVVVFLMTFVVPSLTQIFLDMNQSLPSPTRFLIAISGFLQKYLWLLLLGFLMLTVVLVTYLKSEGGRMLRDRTLLRVPLLGKLIRQIEAVRLARTLGSLLASGIGVLEAFGIVRDVVQNRYIRRKLERVREQIERGDTIARAIRRTGLFGPLLYHSIAIGEASGNVEEQLLQAAVMYEEEIEVQTRSLTSLLEPAILLILGLIVGFIVLATLLPIFEINQMW